MISLTMATQSARQNDCGRGAGPDAIGLLSHDIKSTDPGLARLFAQR